MNPSFKSVNDSEFEVWEGDTKLGRIRSFGVGLPDQAVTSIRSICLPAEAAQENSLRTKTLSVDMRLCLSGQEFYFPADINTKFHSRDAAVRALITLRSLLIEIFKSTQPLSKITTIESV